MPTARGIGTGLVGVFSLAAGLLLGYPELVIVGLFALAAVLLGLLWVRGPRQLDLARLLDRGAVSRGTDLPVLLAVTNTSAQAFLGGRVGDVLTNRFPVVGVVPDRHLSVKVGRIAPHGQITTTYRLPTDTRGVFDLGPLSFERSDVFGLFRVSSRLPGTEQFVVYPTVHSLANEANGRQQSAPSRTADAAMNASVAFDRLREYVVGDDLRRVHWRTSARTGVLMMRETMDEVVDDVTIVIDDSLEGLPAPLVDEAAMTPAFKEQLERYEAVLEIAASLAVHTSLAGEQCRVITTAGRKASLGARQPDPFPLFEMLAGCAPSPRGLVDAASELRATRPGGRIVIVSALRTHDVGRQSLVGVATEIANRHRQALLIEVGQVSAPTSLRSLSIWGVKDSAGFAAAWISGEGPRG